MDNFGHQFKRTGGLLFSPVEPYPLYYRVKFLSVE